MDFFHLIVHLAEAIAWPLSAFGIALLFRHSISKALSRMTEFHGFGVKLLIPTELEKASDEISYAAANETYSTSNARLSDDYKALLEIAEAHPNAAITEAFRKLEVQARRTLKVKGLGRNYKSNNIYASIRDDLREAGILEDSEVDAFDRLRKIRNEVAHTNNVASKTSATEYVLLASALNTKLHEIILKSVHYD